MKWVVKIGFGLLLLLSLGPWQLWGDSYLLDVETATTAELLARAKEILNEKEIRLNEKETELNEREARIQNWEELLKNWPTELMTVKSRDYWAGWLNGFCFGTAAGGLGGFAIGFRIRL